ncbi:hypothetical protein TSOC_001825 [Tetrabaena socialis]|uniref:Uncharacterized protein n=1 Tax=Tetrabaena socialis TaxID=47790 RepID=A0A2J8AFV0_9CHLO|nr:hypothetical protein TSOC_001825 [Tetrabaena socialis]|eukprot:PNH11395.1 hypothetical protein TSOC_001825 [Tetrabaena socialis]
MSVPSAAQLLLPSAARTSAQHLSALLPHLFIGRHALSTSTAKAPTRKSDRWYKTVHITPAAEGPRPRDKVISHILNYVHTDAACCLYEESAVARRQKQPLPPAVLSACAAYLTPHKQLGVHPCHTPFRPCPVLPALPARLGMSLYHVFVPILSGLQSDLGWRFVMSASIAGSAQTDELVEGVRRWLEGQPGEG